MSPKIGVHPDKFELAISSVEGPHIDKNGKPFQPKAQVTTSVSDLLEIEYDSDAHATAYNVKGEEQWPLIKKVCLFDMKEKGMEVVMTVLIFDWDTPDHAPWTDELFADACGKLDQIADHAVLGKWSLLYTTAKGLRLIYTLDAPVSVEDGEHYLAYMFTLFDEAGFAVDENCKDWTRRFRCPCVLRDGKRTSSAPYFTTLTSDAILPVSLLKKLPSRVIPKHISTEVKHTDQPAHDEVDGYLRSKGTSGNRNQSAFYKEAKQALKNTSPHACLFNPDVPLCESGDRNNTIMRFLGICIPRLLNAVPYLSPQQVYALFHGPVSQLDHADQDWYAHTWQAILSIWPVEVAKYNEAEKEKAGAALKAHSEIQMMGEGMKDWCTAAELDDEELLPDFVRRHALACVGRYFYAMGKDGHYQPFAIAREQIVSRIRTTFLKDILPTSTFGNNGMPMSMPITEVQNEYSTTVEVVEMRPQYAMEGTIEDMDGKHPKMVCPMYRRNPLLIPKYDSDVDEWLTWFFGHDYHKGEAWIANALAFEEGAICALSITGPPSTGKKLLTVGLSECLEKPIFASGMSISGNWNEELAKTPFLFINEGLPKKQGALPFSELFKQLTGSDPITVQERFKPNSQIVNPMRVIFTANNHDIVADLVKGKELTPDDRQAVGERLLHLNQDAGAANLLREKGEFLHTGQDGRRWIANGVQESNFVVACHFLYLHATRTPSKTKSRYLVTGNCHGNSSTLHRATTAKETTSDIVFAILRMVEDEKKYRTYFHMDTQSGALSVTIAAVRTFVETMESKPMTFEQCSQALRNIERGAPQVRGGMEWHEIDCDILVDKATEWGVPSDNTRRLLARQYTSGYLKPETKEG